MGVSADGFGGLLTDAAASAIAWQTYRIRMHKVVT